MRFYRLMTTIGLTVVFTTSLFGADAKTPDLYKSKCQGCHGADGKATAVGKKLGAKDFTDPDVAKMSEADLVKVTTNGKGKMPAYKGKLTDAQIKELIEYVKDMK